jgi:hypothetical protein
VYEEDLPFGGPSFGECLQEIPPTMGIQVATIDNQAWFDGMDLLTPAFEGLGRSFYAHLNTLLGSSQNTNVFSRQHYVDDGAFEPFTLFEELPVVEAFSIVSISNAEDATFMQAGQATRERATTINALENTTSSCRANRCEAMVDKTIVGTTLYLGAMVVSTKLASIVTFSENKPSERAKAFWFTKGANVANPENLLPSITSNPSRLVESRCIKVLMNVRGSNAFFASGGGNVVYKAPLRAYVHARHPLPLEFWPHPLKDTNLSAKAIMCRETLVLVASNVHLQV